MNLKRKVIDVTDLNGGSHKVDLHIWDTAGQEKYFSLTKSKKDNFEIIILTKSRLLFKSQWSISSI